MNRMLKQALAFFLMTALLFTLAACGLPSPGAPSAGEQPASSKSNAAVKASAGTAPAQSAQTEAESPAPTQRPTVFLPLSINEVMLSNKATLADENGLFPDWVELYNYGGEALSLGGLVLREGSDSWTLPDRTLQPGDYLVIFCDGTGAGELHAGFSLSKDGVDLLLENAEGALIEDFRVPACEEDMSVYRNEEGRTVFTAFPTPGYENSREGYARLQEERVCDSPLQIYEVLPYNEWFLRQSGGYYDLVELKNVSSKDIDLQEYFLSDKGSDRAMYRLPERTLASGERVIVYCSGEGEGSGLIAPFALSADRDQLYLSRADGTLMDYVSLHDIPYRVSYGRMDRQNGFFYFSQPTPDGGNSDGCRLIAEQPVLLGRDGVFEGVESVTVELSAEGEIYYTTDGSAPSEASERYTGPLVLDKTSVVRAISIEPGKLVSAITDLSFIINEGHTLPVVSLVGNPADITGPGGLYRNPTWDMERLGAVMFYEDGQGFRIACGIKLHGATSKLAQEKKSFKLTFRSRFDGELHYDLFENGVTDFSSILLRAAQESTYSTLMRDNIVHQLAIRCFPELPAQDYKYAVLYINGRYWGVYNIREAHSDEHYAYHYGYDPDTVTQWKEVWDKTGPMGDLCRFALNRNLADDENYNYVAEHINIDSVIGWTVLQAWCSNHDCNPPNMRFYYSTEDDMMRFALVDLDLGMFEYDLFDVPLHGSVVDGFRYAYAFNDIANKLMQNRQYQLRMAEQLSAALHGPMSDEAVSALIDDLADQLRPEIQRDRDRWAKGGEGDTVEFWEHGFQMVDYLRDFVTRKSGRAVGVINSFTSHANLTKEEIEQYFGDILNK